MGFAGRTLLRRVITLGALARGLAFHDRRPGLIVLIYHRIGGGTDSTIDLPTQVFARQMRWLRDHYPLISLDQVIDGGLPHASGDLVAVTFDDGCREVYEHAFPVLRTHGIPATVYLPTRYVEDQVPFDFGGYRRPARRTRPLSWDQVREMVRSGLVTIGGHTHCHSDLTHLTEEAARAEVTRCRTVIEDRIGVVPRHFAYPWGRFDPGVRRMVGEVFATAVRGGSAKNPFGAIDLLALWRRPVLRTDGLWFFRFRLASYLDAEEQGRTLAARLLSGAVDAEEPVPADLGAYVGATRGRDHRPEVTHG